VHTFGFDISLVNGDESDCSVVSDFIAYDLASLTFSGLNTKLSFHNCRFSLETVRAILRLATAAEKYIHFISITECDIVDSINLKALEDEFIQLMAKTGLQQFHYSFHPDAFRYEVYMFFSMRNGCSLEVGAPRLEPRQQPGGELLSSQEVRVLIRMLGEVETLNELNICPGNFSADSIIQICGVIASLKRTIILGVTPWDTSNSEANKAICELIRSGRTVKELHLARVGEAHAEFSVDILADALSSSLYLTKIKLNLRHPDLSSAADFVEDLTWRIKYPNRLKEVQCIYSKMSMMSLQLMNDSASKSRFEIARNALSTKLECMQTKQAFVLIAMVYSVTIMKNKAARCPLRTLNVDILRKLAVFVW
jgi:hypothetical protein